jgi:hypothetical protein
MFSALQAANILVLEDSMELPEILQTAYIAQMISNLVQGSQSKISDIVHLVYLKSTKRAFFRRFLSSGFSFFCTIICI